MKLTEAKKSEAVKYETVVVFDSNLTDAEVQQQIEKIDATIKAHDGQIEKQDIWGRRQLAYPINKKEYGIYAVLVYTGDNSLVSDLKRQLQINDFVIRFLTVHKDKYAPDAQRPAPLEANDSFQGGDRFGGDRFGGNDRFGGDRDRDRSDANDDASM